MTFRQFALKNVTRNKRLYAAYFLSSMFTVMVFFTFSIFAFHPELRGESMNGYVSQGMYISAGIIYIFSFFFILYSMSSFLQSRKKEFGLLMIQGMSMKQIRWLVFLENMFLGFLATVGGILMGLVFAKVILLLAENVLIIEERLNFYLPVEAALLTFLSFILLFFVISLFISYILRSRKLIDLIKGDKKSKGEPKANVPLTITALILLGAGYAVALLVEGLMVVAVMAPVILVVTIGTYLLFTQLSVFIIRRLKSKEGFFWFKTNMLLFSDLSFRMKDNARTFFMVAMVSTVAFSAIGTLFGFQTYLTAGTKITNPNTFTYWGYEYDEKDIVLINNVLQDEGIETKQEQVTLQYFTIGEDWILIAKESDFNRFAGLIGEEKINVPDGQLFVAEFEGVEFGQTEQLMEQTIRLDSDKVLKPNELIYSRALPATDSYYIVSDHDHEQLPDPIDETIFHAWQATDGEESVFAAAERINNELSPPHAFTSSEYEMYEINKAYGPVLFVGLFIGIVFFVSAGSFLYFRLYSDLDDDKQKFRSISKMGLTDKELKKVLNRQTMLLFFAPIAVALIHGAVALTALSHMFHYNLFKESVMVLSVFLAIQVIYFFIVRFYYTKQIQAAIQ
ncbi:FtsX-like permease family protein [Bacillus thermotolerans]|uniref:ABC transporter permease protein YvcS n=1 Tax=Bacillus thermotolerans TaxID=1221996 RepID=A0A0F5HQE8_BACTR|nr:ABC transporter permease [Bacillus thermotolerans]KKB35531.1 ABC transporter permease protein YvcS [Bacillus thermotolerans]KKB36055.1 ABC transporter permease protein YvcS [Bacillus thermotolerans]KKB42699.1 ABC transporter permease protein YvcS [Bacillus thermotolerans]